MSESPAPPAASRAARDLHELEVLLASAIPLIAIETHEERHLMGLLVQYAVRARRPLWRWTITEGLARLDIDLAVEKRAVDPGVALSEIRKSGQPAIWVLVDFHPYLDEPRHVRHLKDIAIDRERGHTVVLVAHEIAIPPELYRYSARFELSLPGRAELERLVREEAAAFARERGRSSLAVERASLDRLVQNLLGLPGEDARRLTRRALANDGALTDADIPAVQKEKFRLLSNGGVLGIEHDGARFADVGGFARLKRWLQVRRAAFFDAVAMDRPRGLMLIGVQGCGKSLAAKAVAGAWGVPLLRLDFGALYDKFFGESERNMRDSLRTAAAMAPCVLWIDELEKGIGTDMHDGGTSRRVFGTFLTWLSENDARVFVVATANDISALPPELVRKGRFDEIFFVDLPDEAGRREILSIHLARRGLEPERFDLEALVAACSGFSGAELEQVVVSGIYAARAQNSPPGAAHLLLEASHTQPLSVVMREAVDALRSWSVGRTVPAD
ncbi:MAG: AAA family ATPase [Gammaproteobacteria bacterium]